MSPEAQGGIADEEDDGETFDHKMNRLMADLAVQFKKSGELEMEIRKNFRRIGYRI